MIENPHTPNEDPQDTPPGTPAPQDPEEEVVDLDAFRERATFSARLGSAGSPEYKLLNRLRKKFHKQAGRNLEDKEILVRLAMFGENPKGMQDVFTAYPGHENVRP